MSTTSLSYPVPERESVVRRVWAALRRVRRWRTYHHDVLATQVRRALALPRRGGVAHDELTLHAVSAQMHVEWTARAVHPWDRDLPAEQQDELFAQQCLGDVDAALRQLFEQFETVEHIDVTVVHPMTGDTVLAGLVSRLDFVGARRLSASMRLKMAGLTYEIGRGGLQSIRR